MDPGFGAWMHLMSSERMDARNDQVRDDGVQGNGVGLDDGDSIGEQLEGFNIPTNPHRQFIFT